MSWAGRIVSTSMSTVNSEVGYSASAQTGFNDDRVRCLANKTTLSTTVAMDNMRFGLQLPQTAYSLSGYANTQYLAAADSGSGSALAYCGVLLSSNGAGQFYTYTQSRSPQFQIEKSFTWLTTGSAGDYTAEWATSTGTPSGSAVNTDLALSTTRDWNAYVFTNTLYTPIDITVIGTIRIKRSGVIGPYRKFELYAFAVAL